MTPVIGYAWDLHGHPDLAGLEKDFAYAWLEGVLEAKLTWLGDSDNWHDLTRWVCGRLFGEIGEYRWQQEAGGVHVVLILDKGALPPQFLANPTLPLVHEGDSPLILFGDWVDPDKDKAGNPDDGPRFYAREIPRPQYYPMEVDAGAFRQTANDPAQSLTPRVVVRRYRHMPQNQEDHRGEFLRCVRITWQSTAESPEGTSS